MNPAAGSTKAKAAAAPDRDAAVADALEALMKALGSGPHWETVANAVALLRG